MRHEAGKRAGARQHALAMGLPRHHRESILALNGHLAILQPRVESIEKRLAAFSEHFEQLEATFDKLRKHADSSQAEGRIAQL